MRLFFAIAMPEAVRWTLGAGVTALRAHSDEVRWVRPAGWHLTLAFLGDVSVGGRARAQHAMGRAAVNARPCDLSIDGRLGRFGERVLWAAVTSRDGHLEALVGRLRDELAVEGLRVEDRPFQAHLTLARGRRGQRLPSDPALAAPGLPCHWTAARVGLLSSRLGGPGGCYHTLATWPLPYAPLGAGT